MESAVLASSCRRQPHLLAPRGEAFLALQGVTGTPGGSRQVGQSRLGVGAAAWVVAARTSCVIASVAFCVFGRHLASVPGVRGWAGGRQVLPQLWEEELSVSRQRRVGSRGVLASTLLSIPRAPSGRACVHAGWLLCVGGICHSFSEPLSWGQPEVCRQQHHTWPGEVTVSQGDWLQAVWGGRRSSLTLRCARVW